MYAIYRELNPPTGVEHCIECNFFNENQKSLVVAATSVLRVYNLCKVRWCASFRIIISPH
jgi:cleavage and polyadenylation specificity factor subunit 1